MTVKRSISVLLSRCLDDVDDEVRDRAAMYLRFVFSLSALESKLVSYVNDTDASKQPFDVSSIPKISRPKRLLRLLVSVYTIQTVDIDQHTRSPSSLDTISAPVSKKPDATAVAPPPTAAETQSAYAAQLAAVPELAS
ncbi:hypothetical protein JB92DRAFT_3129313 [Gautieria morchelliformis]|nr:hypothetical protein JB92DRAFT_3129313 [Gautieria morchelliformis]